MAALQALPPAPCFQRGEDDDCCWSMSELNRATPGSIVRAQSKKSRCCAVGSGMLLAARRSKQQDRAALSCDDKISDNAEKILPPSQSSLSSSTDYAERGQALVAACVMSSISGEWKNVVRFILEGNMDLEQMQNGRTAAMIAAEHPAALPVLDLLIKRGASCSFVGL